MERQTQQQTCRASRALALLLLSCTTRFCTFAGALALVNTELHIPWSAGHSVHDQGHPFPVRAPGGGGGAPMASLAGMCGQKLCDSVRWCPHADEACGVSFGTRISSKSCRNGVCSTRPTARCERKQSRPCYRLLCAVAPQTARLCVCVCVCTRFCTMNARRSSRAFRRARHLCPVPAVEILPHALWMVNGVGS